MQGLHTGLGSSSLLLPNGDLFVCGHGFYAIIDNNNTLSEIVTPLKFV